MTNDELQALLAYWVRILRLQDWSITAAFWRNWDMKGYAGFATSNAKLMTCRVEILDPLDHNPHAEFDIEETLVHELLHVRFAHLDAKWEGGDLVLYEQAIEQMAQSYVRLNRGQR